METVLQVQEQLTITMMRDRIEDTKVKKEGAGLKKVVGTITDRVIQLLGLNVPSGKPVYLGNTNVQHMIARHPQDYQKYGADIEDILENPDYVGLNSKDNSIEYVKEYQINNEFVKVAVRVSLGGEFYARSLYVLNTGRTQRFIQKGKLLPY